MHFSFELDHSNDNIHLRAQESYEALLEVEQKIAEGMHMSPDNFRGMDTAGTSDPLI